MTYPRHVTRKPKFVIPENNTETPKEVAVTVKGEDGKTYGVLFGRDGSMRKVPKLY